jgi:hypothetical protein
MSSSAGLPGFGGISDTSNLTNEDRAGANRDMGRVTRFVDADHADAARFMLDHFCLKRRQGINLTAKSIPHEVNEGRRVGQFPIGRLAHGLSFFHAQQYPSPESVGEGSYGFHQAKCPIVSGTSFVLNEKRLIQVEHPAKVILAQVSQGIVDKRAERH